MSATGRAFAFCARFGCADGWRDGNRPAALPPGLSVGPADGMAGRVVTESGVVVVTCCCGGTVAAAAVMVTLADAIGSLGRRAALPMAVSVTDLTADASAGTVTCAWSCRFADLASTAPRSHDAVPSLLPQPKLNRGVTLVGIAVSLMVASGTFPPVVQALMTHWAGSPRLLLACDRVTATQSLTSAAAGGCFVVACAVALGVGEALVFGFELDGAGCA